MVYINQQRVEDMFVLTTSIESATDSMGIPNPLLALGSEASASWALASAEALTHAPVRIGVAVVLPIL